MNRSATYLRFLIPALAVILHFNATVFTQKLDLVVETGGTVAFSIAYSPDGRLIAIGYGNSVRVLEAETGDR